MRWYGSRKAARGVALPTASSQIPVAQFDLGKRYDVYCTDFGHDRLYEDVRFVDIRTFDRLSEFSSGLVGGFLEFEGPDGSRWMIPNFGIRLVCEHGTRPVYKILRHRRDRQGY